MKGEMCGRLPSPLGRGDGGEGKRRVNQRGVMFMGWLMRRLPSPPTPLPAGEGRKTAALHNPPIPASRPVFHLSPFTFHLSLILALLLPLPARADSVERLHRFLETTQSVRASFAQIVVAKNGRRPQQSSGVMIFSRPGKFRWQIDKPYSQLLVGDGVKVWMYDPDLRQVTVKQAGAALGGTPAALLAGESGQRNALEKDFTLRDEGPREGLEWVEATPKNRDSGFEKLRLGFAGAELAAMELFDNFGQTTTLHFSNLERNPALAASLFSFSPPPGVDVISE